MNLESSDKLKLDRKLYFTKSLCYRIQQNNYFSKQIEYKLPFT